MDLDLGTWQQAARKVRRAAALARVLWLAGMLAPPVLALVALPGWLLESLVVSIVSLVLVRRVVFALGAGRTVASWHERITADGPDLSRFQVALLLHDGMVQGDGCVWMTTHADDRFRLVAEGREPGVRARSSSPWLWAMGGSGV